MKKTDCGRYTYTVPLIKHLKKNNKIAFAKSSNLLKGESNADQVHEYKEVYNINLSKELCFDKCDELIDNHKSTGSTTVSLNVLAKKLKDMKLDEPIFAESRDNDDSKINEAEIQIKYLACISRDAKLNYYYNSTSALKYLNLPKEYTDSMTGEKVFNLFYQWSKFTGFAYRREIPRLITLYQLLEQYEVLNKVMLYPDFLSNKSILKYIMGIANQSEVLSVEANVKLTKDGIICLSNNHYRSATTSMYSFVGHRFENIVSFSEISDKGISVKERLDNPTVDNFESFYLLLNVSLKPDNDCEPISIIFTSEVDCATTDDKPVDDLTNYVELKCICITGISQMDNILENRKIVDKIKIAYFQTLLSGGNTIVVGFRSEPGYLIGIKLFSLTELEQQLRLNRKLIMSNFYNAIKWIKENVTSPEKAYRLFLNGNKLRLNEYADEDNKRLISEYSYNEECFKYRSNDEGH